jgi:hypothetical protein
MKHVKNRHEESDEFQDLHDDLFKGPLFSFVNNSTKHFGRSVSAAAF